MDRSRLLKLLVILMVAGVILGAGFEGCRWGRPYQSANSYSSKANRPSASGPKITTLRVTLQGPFAVIVRRNDKNRITAYVPYDQGRMHQFYFPDSHTPQKGPSYRFVLSEAGLETSNRPPYMDHGFDDFNVGLTGWKPNLKDYYVALDLPAPDVVTYIPPAEGVLFEPESQGASPRFGRIPNSHVLEYRVDNASQIILSSPELGELRPMPCRDPRTQYSDSDPIPCSQSVSYFLGVGLPDGWDAGPDSIYLKDHAIRFFNDKLLPSMFGAHIPQGLKLLRVGVDPSQRQQYTGSLLTFSVFRYPLLSRPRIVEVGLGSPAGSNCLLSATGYTYSTTN